MTQRLLKRGETSGRSDDNAESIVKRLKTFVEQTVPVAEYFEKKGKIARINANEGTADEVYQMTRNSLQ
jgi:UMP-CMP kinase